MPVDQIGVPKNEEPETLSCHHFKAHLSIPGPGIVQIQRS